MLGAEEDAQPAVRNLPAQREVLRPHGGEIQGDVLSNRVHAELERLARPAGLAIVGMAARFGDLADVDALDRALYEGRAERRQPPPGRWNGLDGRADVLEACGVTAAALADIRTNLGHGNSRTMAGADRSTMRSWRETGWLTAMPPITTKARKSSGRRMTAC